MLSKWNSNWPIDRFCRFEVYWSNVWKVFRPEGPHGVLRWSNNSTFRRLVPRRNLFIYRIAALRPNTVNDFKVKFGIDYGQSFLNVTMALTTASRHSSGQRNSCLNGGEKTMELAVCQAPETYAKLKSLFTLLKAPHDLECVYACILKVINIATGLSSHSMSAHWDVEAPLRAIKLNSGHYHLWKRTSGKKNPEQIFLTAWTFLLFIAINQFLYIKFSHQTGNR